MADEGKTYEEVVIELTTNFEQVLKRDLTQYTTFVKKTGDTARSLEKSFTTVAKTVSDNVRGMFQSSVKEINASVSASRLQMRQVLTQSIAVNDLYKKTFNDLTLKQKEFQAEIKKSNDAVASIKPMKGDDKTKAGLVDQRKAEIQEKTRQLTEQFKQETERTLQQFYKSLGSISSQASKALVQISDTNLKSVQKTAKDLISQFNMIKSQMGMQTDIVQVTSGTSKFKEMKAQNDNLQKALRDQAQLTYNAEVQMQQAKLAVIKSTDKQILDSNIKAFKETLVNQSKVREIYKQLEGDVRGYGNAVDKAESEVRQMAQALQSTIKSGIKPTDVTSKMTKAMDLLVDYARKTGMGMTDALFKNMRESSDVESALNKSIKKLEEMRTKAVALQKTGLVDTTKEVAKIDTILAKYKEFWTTFKREQSNVRNLLGSEKTTKTGAADFDKILKNYNQLAQEARKYSQINQENFIEAQTSIKKVEAAWNSVLAKRKEVNNRIIAIQDQMFKLNEAKNNESNAKIRAEYDRHLKRLEDKIRLSRARMSKDNVDTSFIGQSYTKIEAAAIAAQNNIKNKFLQTNKQIEASVEEISREYQDLISVSAKIMNKKFVSQESIESAKKGFNDLKAKVVAYEQKIRETIDAIRVLEKIQRAGLGGEGIQKLTDKLRANVAQMRSHSKSLNDYAGQVQKNFDNVQRKSMGSIVRRGWEMVRNFRWQVAAIIYLFSRAAMTIRTTFFNVINETQEFRKQAMSIASNVAYKMVGNIEQNYERAYQYSRGLMVKLELEAARTILTLEDMLMLTKTFAQAGIIPETDEDVRKIATIGTAIKALTEGMANSGVQMRQELYAIIAGRQRATDQLAMMFRMMGVNIQEVIDKGKKEGKSMIDTLSEALAPFEQMNKMLAGEFETIKNKLTVIWGIIKRLAGEPILKDLAAELDNVANMFFNMKEKVLTPLGEEMVQGVRAGLRVMMELGKATIGIIMSIWSSWKQSLNTIDAIGTSLGLWKSTLDGLGSENLAGIVRMAKVLLWTFTTINLTIYDTITTINVLVQSVRWAIEGITNLADYASAAFTLHWSELKGIAEKQSKLNENTKKAWSDFLNLLNTNKAAYEDIDKLIEQITKSINNLSKEQVSIGMTFELPTTFDNMKQTMGKVYSDWQQMKLAASEGPVKFDLQLEFDLEKYAETKAEVIRNIEWMDSFFLTVKEGWTRIPPEQEKAYKEIYAAHQQYLKQITSLEDAAAEKRKKDTTDWIESERKKTAQAMKQWKTLLIELRGKPETRDEQTKKWGELEIEKIKELIETNKIGAKETQEAWDALYEGYQDRMRQNAEALNNDMEELKQQITSHDMLNEFEKIDNEFEKIILKIKENVDLNDVQRLQLMELVQLNKERRIEQERIAQNQKMTLKLLDLESKKASFLQKDFMPDIDKKKGKILEVRNNYVKAMTAIQYEIDNLHQTWQKEPGIWNNNTEAFQQHVKILLQELSMLKQEFKFDSFVINLPYSFTELEQALDRIKDKTVQLKKDSLTGPVKFKYEFTEEISSNKEQREKILEQLAEAKRQFADANELDKSFYSPEQREKIQEIINEYEKSLELIDGLDAAAKEKLTANTNKWAADQKKSLAQARRQWEVFLIELEGKPETKKEKTDKWFEEQQERVQELIETNKYGAEESQRAWTALYKGYSERQKQDVRDIKNEMTELINSITSHDALNEFEKIDNEFEKIYQTIKSNIELNDHQELQYMELAYLAKERRIEEEKIAAATLNTAKQSELLLAKAKYMQESFSPLEQTKGEILELRQAYGQALNEIDAKIKNTELMFMEKGEWTKNSQAAQRYWELLRQEFVLTQAAFERDLYRKQHPLWNDLQEMSQNWADGLSDSLATLVVDFENFGDSIKSLWQSILQDTVKASIKRSLMDPLMDALGNGEGEGGSKMWRFGKETAKSGMGSIADAAKKNMSEMDKLISEGRPMPVYVVESPDIKGLTNTMDETKDAVKETGKQTNETLNNGFSGMQSALTNIASGAASGNPSQMASGMMQLIGAIGSAYGGGMGGGLAAGATRLSNGAIVNPSGVVYGMAEGGTISEHIVGKGLRSGRVYEFGERSKYGEFEDVVPKSKMNSGVRSGQAVSLSMPIYLSAIDTRSGVEFITQNQKVIENNMIRSMKNNKAIRGMIRQSW